MYHPIYSDKYTLHVKSEVHCRRQLAPAVLITRYSSYLSVISAALDVQRDAILTHSHFPSLSSFHVSSLHGPRVGHPETLAMDSMPWLYRSVDHGSSAAHRWREERPLA